MKIFKRTIPQSNATNWFAKCARTKCFICGIKQSEYKLKEKAETNNNNNRDKLRNLGRKKNHCWIFRHFSNCLNVINSCGRSCLMTNLYLRNLVPLMTALFSFRPPPTLFTLFLFTLLKNNCSHYIRLFQAFWKNKRAWCLKQWIAGTMIIFQQWHS